MLRILGRLKAKEVAGKIRMLQEDKTPVIIFENGRPVETSIGALAGEALQSLES
jgi:hypothetical protein